MKFSPKKAAETVKEVSNLIFYDIIMAIYDIIKDLKNPTSFGVGVFQRDYSKALC